MKVIRMNKFYLACGTIAITVLFVVILSLYSGFFGIREDSSVHVKILAVNDFHGHLFPEQELNDRPVGSAPVLASYLKSIENLSGNNNTIIALIGDTVGASPRQSAILLNEPTTLFFNTIVTHNFSEGSNVIAIPGNHEFNRGTDELLRMVHGGNDDSVHPRLVDPYPGSNADYICANVVWKKNGIPIFSPYTIRTVDGVPIAFIGAVTIETPNIEFPDNVEKVQFLDEVKTINGYVEQLQKQGVHAFVILLHEGGNQNPYGGSTREGCNVTGPITYITAGLDSDVDVVLAAHKHAFTNAYLPNSGKKDVLVTQAYSYGEAFADVDITLDPKSKDIIEKSAIIVPAYADQSPGITLDPAMQQYLKDVDAAVSKIENQALSYTSIPITRKSNPAGESSLGDLIADSQRSEMHTDIAFADTGSLNSNQINGTIKWKDLESVLSPDSALAAKYGGQYSHSRMASSEFTGEGIHEALERQWGASKTGGNISVSGMTYVCNVSQPVGKRISNILVNGVQMDPKATYTAAVTLSSAKYLKTGKNLTFGPEDLDALVTYVRSSPKPLTVTGERICLLS